MVKSAQQQNLDRSKEKPPSSKSNEPRRIEILDESSTSNDNVADMRKQVEELQEELRRMQK
jgi:hypothetical protein